MPQLRLKATGQIEEIPDAGVLDALATGLYEQPGAGVVVPVNLGQHTGQVTGADLGYAAGIGATPESEAGFRARERATRIEREHGGALGTAGAFVEQGIDAATFGGYGALTDLAWGDDYTQARRERAEANPVASGLGEAAGLIAPALLSGGAGLAGDLARLTPAGMASRLGTRIAEGGGREAAATRVADFVASAPSLTRAAAGYAVEGGLYGAGHVLSESILKDKELSAEAFLAGAGSGAAMGGLGGLGVSLFSRGARAAKRSVDSMGANRAIQALESEQRVAAKEAEKAARKAEKAKLELQRHANRLEVEQLRQQGRIEAIAARGEVAGAGAGARVAVADKKLAAEVAKADAMAAIARARAEKASEALAVEQAKYDRAKMVMDGRLQLSETYTAGWRRAGESREAVAGTKLEAAEVGADAKIRTGLADAMAKSGRPDAGYVIEDLIPAKMRSPAAETAAKGEVMTMAAQLASRTDDLVRQADEVMSLNPALEAELRPLRDRAAGSSPALSDWAEKQAAARAFQEQHLDELKAAGFSAPSQPERAVVASDGQKFANFANDEIDEWSTKNMTPPGWTDDQKSVFKQYQNTGVPGSSHTMNPDLRLGNPLEPHDQKLADELDRLFASPEFAIPTNVMTYRGVELGSMPTQVGAMVSDPAFLSTSLSREAATRYLKGHGGKAVGQGGMIDTRQYNAILDAGLPEPNMFADLTDEQIAAIRAAGLEPTPKPEPAFLMEIEVPAGTPGMSMPHAVSDTANMTEFGPSLGLKRHEILLPRGTPMRVVSVDPEARVVRVRIERPAKDAASDTGASAGRVAEPAEIAAAENAPKQFLPRTRDQAAEEYAAINKAASPDQVRAADIYTTTDYRQVQGYLRGRQPKSELELEMQAFQPEKVLDEYGPGGGMSVQDTVKHLDDLIAASPAPSDMLVYRGLQGSEVPVFKQGEVLQDAAYQSVSMDPDVAKRFVGGITIGGQPPPGLQRAVLEIEVPSGTPMAYISPLAGGAEAEALLARGTPLEVLSVVDDDGVQRVRLRVKAREAPEAASPPSEFAADVEALTAAENAHYELAQALRPYLDDVNGMSLDDAIAGMDDAVSKQDEIVTEAVTRQAEAGATGSPPPSIADELPDPPAALGGGDVQPAVPPMGMPEPPLPTMPPMPGGAAGKVGEASTALGVLDLAAALGGLPNANDIPVIGPLVGTYLKYRAVRGALGKIGLRTGGPVARIAQGAAATQDKAAQAISALVNGAEKVGPALRSATPPLTTVLSRSLWDLDEDERAPTRKSDAPVKKTSPQKLYEKRREELLMVAEDPDAARQELAETIPAPPALAAAIADTVVRRLEWLAGLIPQSTRAPTIRPEPVMASPADMERLALGIAATADPVGTVMGGIARGAVSPVVVQALREVYPRLYAQMQADVIETVSTSKNRIPYNRKLNLSYVFDVPIDSTMQPGYIAARQEEWAMAAQEQQPPASGPQLQISSQSELGPLRRAMR